MHASVPQNGMKSSISRNWIRFCPQPIRTCPVPFPPVPPYTTNMIIIIIYIIIIVITTNNIIIISSAPDCRHLPTTPGWRSPTTPGLIQTFLHQDDLLMRILPC